MMGGLYLALGDSLTTGYDVGPDRSFPTLYYQQLRRSYPSLSYVNLGVNGQTIKALLGRLRWGRVLKLVAQASLITITIGSNDLLKAGKRLLRGRPVNMQAVLDQFDRQLSVLGLSIRSLNPSAEVKIATIYNPFNTTYQPSITIDPMLLSEIDIVISQANTLIAKHAATYNFKVIAVDRAFRGLEHLLLAADGLHPNPLGHQLLAELFYKQ